MLRRHFQKNIAVFICGGVSSSLHHERRGFSYSNIFTKQETELSIKNPEKFWGDRAENEIDWFQKYTSVLPHKSINDIADIKNATGQDEQDCLAWFPGSTLNMSYNCLDRHLLNGHGNRVAIHYDSPVSGEKKSVTYQKLFDDVNILARVLSEQLGVKKGDVVIIYMPNGVRAVTAMLACSRIGAIHSNVFGGFAPTELAKRIDHSGAKVILTCTGSRESHRLVDYAKLVEEALALVPESTQVEHVLIHQRQSHDDFRKLHSTTTINDTTTSRFGGREKIWKELTTAMKIRLAKEWNENIAANRKKDNNNNQQVAQFQSSPFYLAPVPVEGSHPLYLLYTSGTTGSPKGCIHETAGMAVVLMTTMKHVFGLDSGDTMMALSDLGWVVGHSYMIYSCLLKCCTTVIFEGKPTTTPDSSSFFRMIQDYRVNVMFTAPTAMRAIRAVDEEGLLRKKYDISSLKLFFIAGERSDPPTVKWCEEALGVPCVDNYWQTETGAPISSAPYDPETKMPKVVIGSGGQAAPGWNLCEVKQDDENSGSTTKLTDENSPCGLAARFPLAPGVFTALWRRRGDLLRTYCPDRLFLTFDAGHLDQNGFLHVMSRSDDVINVAAHRLSTGQLEQAIATHDATAESAVVGRPCALKGERPVAFVVTKANYQQTSSTSLLESSINEKLRQHVGPIASSEIIRVPKLPKTRSGKVLRKLLREIVAGVEREKLNVSPTIEDLDVVDSLVKIVKEHFHDKK